MSEVDEVFKSHGALQRERDNPYSEDLVAELKKTFMKSFIKVHSF